MPVLMQILMVDNGAYRLQRFLLKEQTEEIFSFNFEQHALA
jgi:hypothetical protein